MISAIYSNGKIRNNKKLNSIFQAFAVIPGAVSRGSKI